MNKLLKVAAIMGSGYSRTFPQNLLISTGTMLEDFETIGDWTPSGGSIAADTTHHITGIQSIQMTGDVGAITSMSKAVNVNLSSWTQGRICIYVNTPTDVHMLRLILQNSSGNYFRHNWAIVGESPVGQGLRTGWNLIQFLKTDFTTVGNPSWDSPITLIQFNLTSDPGKTAIVSIDSLQLGVDGIPSIIWSFDDGNSTCYELYQYLKIHNQVATQYVVSNNMNNVGNLTSAQLVEMNRYGWDIGNHTRDHTNLVSGGLTDEQITAEFVDCATFLNNLGLTRASLHASMPFSDWNAQVTIDAQAAGILSVRDDTNTGRYFGLPMPTWILWYRWGSGLNTSTSLVDAKARVDVAVARKIPLVLCTDGVMDTATGSRWGRADFQALAAYIAGLQLPTFTISELYALQSGPITVNHH